MNIGIQYNYLMFCLACSFGLLQTYKYTYPIAVASISYISPIAVMKWATNIGAITGKEVLSAVRLVVWSDSWGSSGGTRRMCSSINDSHNRTALSEVAPVI